MKKKVTVLSPSVGAKGWPQDIKTEKMMGKNLGVALLALALLVSPSFIASSSSQTVEAQANEETEAARHEREREKQKKAKDSAEADKDVAIEEWKVEKARLGLLGKKIKAERLKNDNFDEERATLRIKKQKAVVDVAEIDKKIAAKEFELERAIYNLLLATQQNKPQRVERYTEAIERIEKAISELNDSKETEEGEEKPTDKDERPGDKVARLCKELRSTKKKK